jgi:hypothetical protein
MACNDVKVYYKIMELLQRWMESFFYLKLIIAWGLIIESQVLAMRCKKHSEIYVS